ncbi:competence/damage-inducible protein A [Bacteroidota bacterium]
MKAELISIGDELLIGQVVNTNASWIAQQLNLAGIEVNRIIAIADSENEIFHALDNVSETSEIAIITGGLGPTSDDITKAVICKYFDTKLILDQKALINIEKRFGDRGYTLTEINRKQAEIPESCTPIYNVHGTASGMIFEKDGRTFYFLPGVPYEMKQMIGEEIIPKLVKKNPLISVVHKTVLTQGVGESFLSDKIISWESNLPEEVKIAYLPSPGLVRIRLTAIGEKKETLKSKLNTCIFELNKIIPKYIYGYDSETLEEIIGNLLRDKNATLSTAESCTGGFIAHKITSVPGSSSYFKGSLVAYSNEIKQKFLEVSTKSLNDFGAVSETVVKEMAEGVLKKFKTDYSIAVSGIAGPDGGTVEKPVGTIWIAVASKESVITKKFLFGDHRERNIIKTELTALNMLRNFLLL